MGQCSLGAITEPMLNLNPKPGDEKQAPNSAATVMTKIMRLGFGATHEYISHRVKGSGVELRKLTSHTCNIPILFT